MSRPVARDETPAVKPGVYGTVQRRESDNYPWFGGTPGCQHLWMIIKWSGYECNDCPAWYCA